MNKKTIIGGLAATVAYLLMGMLIYGMLLAEYMGENLNSTVLRAQEDYVWWALIVSNLCYGFLMALALGWANTRGFASGMQRGLILGLLTVIGYDLGLYFMSVYYMNSNVVIVDVCVITGMSAIAGGIIGMINGSGKNTANATS